MLNMQSASTGRRSKHMQVQALITRSGQSTHLVSLKLARDVGVVTVVARVGVVVVVVVVVVVRRCRRQSFVVGTLKQRPIKTLIYTIM